MVVFNTGLLLITDVKSKCYKKDGTMLAYPIEICWCIVFAIKVDSSTKVFISLPENMVVNAVIIYDGTLVTIGGL